MTAQEKKEAKIQNKIAASIKKANTAYKKATPAQRRVMIAKDVIKRLKIGQVRATMGAFLDIGYGPSRVVSNASLQEVIHNPLFEKGFDDGKVPVCKVCGIGGLFVSAVAFRNKCKLSPAGTSPSKFAPLYELKEFSVKQRQLIELAFEYGCGYYSILGGGARMDCQVEGTMMTRAAANWRRKYFKLSQSSKCVLIAIAKNIIKHKGKFNPLVK